MHGKTKEKKLQPKSEQNNQKLMAIFALHNRNHFPITKIDCAFAQSIFYFWQIKQLIYSFYASAISISSNNFLILANFTQTTKISTAVFKFSTLG